MLKASDFERVFAAPRRSSDRFFTVLARDNGLDVPRLGIAVGKKVIRRAVGRNRIKRLVRESFRHHADALGGVDIIVLGRFGGSASNDALRRSLATHWKRVRQQAAATR